MQLQSRLIANCAALLDQLARVLELVDDQTYCQTSAWSPRGSIGGHVRHCVDFYQSFINGIDSGRINYNYRRQDPRIEVDRRYAIARIQDAQRSLRSVSPVIKFRPILVSTEDCGLSLSAWCSSSLVRELEFLQSHAIHHFSLIAVLLRLNEIEPGENFGVAPTTLRYWQEATACVR
jgi:hypothetical protein